MAIAIHPFALLVTVNPKYLSSGLNNRIVESREGDKFNRNLSGSDGRQEVVGARKVEFQVLVTRSPHKVHIELD